MFREGHYLEVIKASDDCLATAIVTIKEKTVEYKKKKITTNKWLDLQDWASLYSIIRKAIIRNYEHSKSRGRIDDATERIKSTSHMEVKYKFETTETPEDRNQLPTIRVNVAPVRKSSKGSKKSQVNENVEEIKKTDEPSIDAESDRAAIIQQLSENDSFLSENYSLEEYVPPELPSSTKVSAGFDYVPSRKSTLLRMRSSTDVNKYTPTTGTRLSSGTNDNHTEVSYIPNPIKSLTKLIPEGYDPCATSTLSSDLSETYVPSSKGAKTKVEEYQPDFASTTMKFDDSYVPSSTYSKVEKDESKKRSRKNQDSKNKKSSSSRSLISKIAKREL